ncbi:dethiobiotin synthase [Thauera propionica]|uniref:ATP-dependent dethiobiotin synthetase BioD n=1 Tax=Thauera propionica TaxID=2019431 RepID=A0A235EY58_9RHOO|nr:dethiobiotin synthase [Thauera propionica]MDD3677143.1 dethiobiotin synthase [Thauera propionica]OYD53944.1 dethiobiotin synthase [Thauera propionica]
MVRGCFITGTDTEIGKTTIAAAIVSLLGKTGLRVAGLKPVAAGMSAIDGERINEDVHALRAASSVPLGVDEIAPFQFEAACAPHVAAALEGRSIDRDRILATIQAAAARCDRVVVEGVGGFRVPFDAAGDWDSADLARDLGLPVLLVVGLRLGAINHALLTAEAVRARGLRLCGWVANTVDPAMAQASATIDALTVGLGNAPCLGLVPRLPAPSPEAIAPYLNVPALHHLFDSDSTLKESP